MALPQEFAQSLSPEALNELPIRRYEGDVLLVETLEGMELAAADLAAERVVGFDTETRPAFRPGESYPPALAQAATARAVYLFPLLRFDFSAVLTPFLSSPATVKTGVGLADDLRQLRQVFTFTPEAFVDLGAVARRHGLEKSGVRTLAGLFLGFRIPKGTKTSNWAAPRLSPQQIGYAATDAWACRELYLKFEALGLL
ncbi:MAG TPA: 3'-5' exonuclease [Burkholderiales bacterium]|nr:3'-5' exonuclease [Burkholderiales bacterium]